MRAADMLSLHTLPLVSCPRRALIRLPAKGGLACSQRCFPEAIFRAGGHAMSTFLRWPMEGEGASAAFIRMTDHSPVVRVVVSVAHRLKSIF